MGDNNHRQQIAYRYVEAAWGMSMIEKARTRWGAVITVVIGCLGMISCGQPDTASVAAQPYPYPIQTAAPTMLPLDATKAADDQRIKDEEATAVARATAGYPIPTQSWPTADPNAPKRLPPTGISIDCDTSYDRDIDETNCWRERTTDNIFIFIVVGAEPATPMQGKLEVYTANLITEETSSYMTYPTQTQHGRLVITEVAFPMITTQAVDGMIFRFNYDTRQWLPPTPTP